MATSPDLRDGANAFLWIVGRVEDRAGRRSGTITSAISPRDLLRDAFQQELSNAGYLVEPSVHLDEESGPGLSVDKVDIRVTEIPAVLSLGVRCSVTVRVAIWESSRERAIREYSARVVDRFVPGDEYDVAAVVQKVLASLMTAAVPDIVRLAGS